MGGARLLHMRMRCNRNQLAEGAGLGSLVKSRLQNLNSGEIKNEQETKKTKKTGERQMSGETDRTSRDTATEDDVAAKVVDKLLQIEHKRREILQKRATHHLNSPPSHHHLRPRDLHTSTILYW